MKVLIKENSVSDESYVPDNEKLRVEYPLHFQNKRVRVDSVIFVDILILDLRIIIRVSVLVGSDIRKI